MYVDVVVCVGVCVWVYVCVCVYVCERERAEIGHAQGQLLLTNRENW